jgi:SAM-dependent methyltransferase
MSAPSDDFQAYTYTAFPQALYRRFADRYIAAFTSAFPEALDLGCGSGGLLLELRRLDGSGALLGVDVSAACIEACRHREGLSDGRLTLLQADANELGTRAELQGRFDLVASYSVLHFVPGDTPQKLRLLAGLTRPGAVVAIDVLARIPWNLFMFSVVKLLIFTGLWGVALKLLGPLVGPSFPKAFLEELGRMRYLRQLRYRNFFDLSCLSAAPCLDDFEVLRLEVVPQDGFFTGRKARFSLRRKPS